MVRRLAGLARASGFALVAVGLMLMAAVEPARAGDSAPAMMTPGGMSVDADGAFIYDVPIAVPPGTAGMVPSLSLHYSSQANDGILGLGWSLGGLPSISRCARTIAQDGVHGGVNYDANDRFCMGGQRLILISGTYGADSSQYRTEIDGFSEVIAHGAAGNGPAWFEVHTKSGQIMQFGDTADSQSLAVGKTTVRAWAVNQITDTAGNYLTVTYTADPTNASNPASSANGVSYPLKISYTGNTAAGLTPYSSVQFSYATRLDVTPFYQAGSLTQRNQVLTDVKTYAGTTLVADYKLKYTAGTSISTSELTSIAQCDGSGVCLPATTFGWQGSHGNPTMTAVPNSLAQGLQVSNTHTSAGLLGADFNGDGLTDLLIVVPSASTCPSVQPIYYGTQSAQSGVFSASNMMFTQGATNLSVNCFIQNQNAVQSGYAFYSLLDIDGDGLADIATQTKRPCCKGTALLVKSPLFRGNGSGNMNLENTADGTDHFADLNGDGRIDYIVDNNPGGTSDPTSLCSGNGDGTFSCASGPSLNGAIGTAWIFADFDGDGCPDILQLTTGATNPVTFMCQPAVATMNLPSIAGATITLGDFNGDGKTDILVTPATGNASIYLSTGTGFSAAITVPASAGWNKYTIVTGDWNGDGKTDIALIAPGGANGTYGPPNSHMILVLT